MQEIDRLRELEVEEDLMRSQQAGERHMRREGTVASEALPAFYPVSAMCTFYAIYDPL